MQTPMNLGVCIFLFKKSLFCLVFCFAQLYIEYMTQEKDIEQMFRRHYEKMYNLARYILSDDDESKDVVSEVFTQILADDMVLLPESEEGYLILNSATL